MSRMIRLKEACAAIPEEFRLRAVCNAFLEKIEQSEFAFEIDYSANNPEYRRLMRELATVGAAALFKRGFLGLAYALCIPAGSAQRSKLGQFFTPPWLADYLIDQIKSPHPHHACDPAAGSGVLLWRFLERHNTSASGFEVDQDLVTIGNISIAASSSHSTRSLAHISQRDSLVCGIPENSLIIANVPFGAAPRSVTFCEQITRYGLKNYRLEELFLLLIMSAVQVGGEALVIVPDSIKGTERGVQLRQILLSQFQLHSVTSVNCPCFRETPATRVSVLHFSRVTNLDFAEPVRFLTLTSKSRFEVGSVPQSTLRYGFHNLKLPLPAPTNELGLPVKTIGELMTKRKVPHHAKSFGTTQPDKYRFHSTEVGAVYFCATADVQEPAILINRNSGCRKARIIMDKDFSVSHTMIVLLFPTLELTEYVYGWLCENREILDYGYCGTNFFGITLAYIKQIRIPVPALLL
jgi:hypothetical protein